MLLNYILEMRSMVCSSVCFVLQEEIIIQHINNFYSD